MHNERKYIKWVSKRYILCTKVGGCFLWLDFLVWKPYASIVCFVTKQTIEMSIPKSWGCLAFHEKFHKATVNLPSHADGIKTCASFDEHLHKLRALGLDGQVERGHPSLLVSHVHINPENNSVNCLHSKTLYRTVVSLKIWLPYT